ncbi:MAG: hypothetical protein IPK88_12865 [Saprospiraceae bacterium]|nr:hypothetical protein [Candidatus Defluviibacterium haderslevense]
MSQNKIQISFGIEEEFYVNSSSHLKSQNFNNISFELFDHQIELKTEVHTSLNELYIEAIENRHLLSNQFKETQIIGSGTYPGLICENQKKLINDRCDYLFNMFGQVLSMVNTCGLHVHIGITDPNNSISIINRARQYVPMLIAISGNSPFYEGKDTLYSSFRNILLSLLPNTGIPPYFKNFNDYIKFTTLLDSKNKDKNYSNKWWDIRFNEKYSTIEYRMFDSHSDFHMVQLFVSLCLLITLKCSEDKEPNDYNSQLLNENRWRACKFGKLSNFIDYQTKNEKPVIELWKNFIIETKSYQSLFEGLENQINNFEELISKSNGADIQRREFTFQNKIMSILDFQNKQFISSCQKI